MNEFAISMTITVLLYCCVCICMSKRAERTVAWVRSVQQECIFPSTGHAECPKFQTGSFVERKAPENFCGLFSPISNPEKIDCVQKSHIFPLTSSNYSIFSKQLGKQEWLCSWTVVVIRELTPSLNGQSNTIR